VFVSNEGRIEFSLEAVPKEKGCRPEYQLVITSHESRLPSREPAIATRVASRTRLIRVGAGRRDGARYGVEGREAKDPGRRQRGNAKRVKKDATLL